MSDQNDRRLIEDYLPIKAISKEASREKSIRKGHISTLHLWWARRPLVACRAAVYGALVPEDQFRPKNGPPEKRKSLGRANAAKFLERLCKYPGNPQVIKEAERHILEAHAERLTKETGEKVTLEDIEQGRAPRPKVLDMFAGGGAIPLEALRLGCEAYALELNPVAHIIELCTLVYPQKYGKPDLNAKGMTGPKNQHGETTWGGLAAEVRYWGEWVLERVREEIGDLYPPIPDPKYKGERPEIEFKKGYWVEKGKNTNPMREWAGINEAVPSGYLFPLAYIWTKIVKCPKPGCNTKVPLVRQTWLCRKKDNHVALSQSPNNKTKRIEFHVVSARDKKSLGFEPYKGSTGGDTVCPICGTVVNTSYIKSESIKKNLSEQLMAVVCIREGKKGKVYIGADDLLEDFTPNYDEIMERIKEIEKENKITIPNEKMITEDSTTVAGRGFGITNWHEIFMTRQLYFLLVFTKHILLIHEKMIHCGVDSERAKAIITYMALALSRLANYGSKMCLWNYTGGRGVVHSFGRQALPMTWDFPESNPLNPIGANWIGGINSIIAVIPEVKNDLTAHTLRGSATEDYFENQLFDAIVTDPPYYDNINYSDLSDFFYIWLKKTIGRLYPEHFSSPLTPKKKEIIVANYRHGNSKIEARKFYEEQMRIAFNRANQKLKNFAPIVIVYAHKTTFGWATLVDSLRKSGFSVEEAWPLDTERPGGFKVDRAMLASSIFLIARKQVNRKTGCYESEVKTELSKIVHERVKSFWEMGITGADLVIASVGAGLRAFTRFARVEYANGEEVPAEHFLAEVETIVLETILKRLSKEVGANSGQFSLAGVDAATRFYILWRYTYKYSVLDAGEAIIFANGTHVELDGPNGLSSGAKALLEKKKGKYRLKDFSDRGSDKKLGLMLEDGQAAPMIDVLHRTLWLLENRPSQLPAFLQEAQPNREQMRLVAQALAGPALKGGELGDISPHAELSALAKLTANWKSVIEGAALTLEEKKEQKTGQRSLFK